MGVPDQQEEMVLWTTQKNAQPHKSRNRRADTTFPVLALVSLYFNGPPLFSLSW